MKMPSLTLETSQLARSEEVFVRCKRALELKDAGSFFGASEVMRPLWQGVGTRPNTTGLHASVAAELLLCAGILSCWIASKNQDGQGQQSAKDLISESITLFESISDAMRVATARVELAYCYWYEGELNEARVMFTEALQRLTIEGNTRAKALVGLARVDWSASRFKDAYRTLADNASLFTKITDHSIQATYHNQIAILLRERAKAENDTELLLRAIREYEEADRHLKLTRNIFFRADLKNNVGNVLRELGRFKEAHKYLNEAQRLAASVKDKLRLAQIDETRAQVFIAEKKLSEAETVARSAVSILMKSDRNGLLAEALITHGITLARLKQIEKAQLCFQKAIATACRVDALNKAGLASLTMIEEVEELSREELHAAFVQAREWLAECQSQELLLRLVKAADKVILRLGGKVETDTATRLLKTKSLDLQKAVLNQEAVLIKQALAKAKGKVTLAATLLGLSHQGLAYIMDTRHKDLLKDRSPIRRRMRRTPKPAND